MPPQIRVEAQSIIWDNPRPTYCSRHAFFPGLVRFPDGELLAVFPVGEAFEAPRQRICQSRSTDAGRSWSAETPLNRRHRQSLSMLKPTLLDNGELIAVGYAFYEEDGRWFDPLTGGAPTGKNLTCRSPDRGRTWTQLRELRHRYPEVLEVSGPCLQLQNGELLAIGSPIPLPDGSKPSGHVGIALRSRDRGRTWDASKRYFEMPPINPLEARLTQLDDGRVVAIVWALDEAAGACRNNMIVVSHDDGHCWSDPIDTGVPGQSSSVLALTGNTLLSIHAQREQEPVGLFVRVVDLSADRWQVVSETCIWDQTTARTVTGYGDMGANVRFGQPSLLALGGNAFLAYNWVIQEGQGRILGHRLQLVD